MYTLSQLFRTGLSALFPSSSKGSEFTPSPDYIALDKPMHWRYIGYRRQFDQSKYIPHQGARECARRRK